MQNILQLHHRLREKPDCDKQGLIRCAVSMALSMLLSVIVSPPSRDRGRSSRGPKWVREAAI
jgi:hypothetical protein